MAVIIN